MNKIAYIREENIVVCDFSWIKYTQSIGRPRHVWDTFTLQRLATTNLLGEGLPVPVDLLDRHTAHDGPLVALHSL